MYEDNMSKYTVKDSGDRRDFGTGAVRDMGAGKGRTDLLPFFALLELAKHFEAGAVKYGDENWRKGIPLRVYLDSAIRHLFKFALGMRDERHDLAALWNIACLIETQNMVDRGLLPPTLDNLPDFFNPPDSPDRPENRGGVDAYPPDWHGLTLTEPLDVGAFDPIPDVGEDVKDVDDWLGKPEFTSGLNYGWVTDGPVTLDYDGPVPVKLTDHPPLDLRPQDRDTLAALENAPLDTLGVPARYFREYTRGHAGETAARFHSGLPYSDDKAPVELDTMNFTGTVAAEAIKDHPLFQVLVIDGPDAAEYDAPDADPLADKAYVIVQAVKGEGQWFAFADGEVSFKAGPGHPCEPSRLHTRDSIRQGILAGRLRVVEAGLLE